MKYCYRLCCRCRALIKEVVYNPRHRPSQVVDIFHQSLSAHTLSVIDLCERNALEQMIRTLLMDKRGVSIRKPGILTTCKAWYCCIGKKGLHYATRRSIGVGILWRISDSDTCRGVVDDSDCGWIGIFGEDRSNRRWTCVVKVLIIVTNLENTAKMTASDQSDSTPRFLVLTPILEYLACKWSFWRPSRKVRERVG